MSTFRLPRLRQRAVPIHLGLVRRAGVAGLAAGALVATMLPAAALAGAAPATVVTCTDTVHPLGAATGWTEFVEGDGTRSSESEGSIAYGGNLPAGGMPVGTRLTHAPGDPALVVAGAHGSFNLHAGSAYLTPQTGVNFNGGGAYLATNPIDFAAAFAHLRSVSTAWGALPDTGTVTTGLTGGNQAAVLTGTDPQVNVFTLTPAQAANKHLGIDVPAGSFALVNVPGGSATFAGQTWLKVGGGWQQAHDDNMAPFAGLLFNFPTATSVTLNWGSAWGGSILAPNAHVVANTAHTIGQVIAASFASTRETHLRLFPSTVCVPGDTPDPPEERSDVTITKTASTASPQGGDTLTYTLTARNIGAATATDVVVRDELPAGVTYVSASAPCTQAAGVVTCSLGDLTVGESRTITITVVANPVAGAGPSSHPQAHHWLTPYKVEQHVDLEPGQTRSITESCEPGDFVSDGSIRIDHVDQDTGTFHDVRVLSSAATGPGAWKAVVSNHATGRVQAKAFIVCLPSHTEVADRQTGHADGHRHPLSVDPTPVTATAAYAVGRHTASVTCPTGTTAIVPGYALSGGAARLVGSEKNGSGWTFTLDVTAPTTATFSAHCLRTTLGSVQGHSHDLVLTHVERTVSIPTGSPVEEQVICPDDAKGIVATWLLPPGITPLGNDPRLKARAFRLWNTSGSAKNALIDLECLGDRTTTEKMGTDDPVVVTNTATISSVSVDADPGNNSATATITVRPGGTTAVVTPRAALRAGKLRMQVVSSMPGSGKVTVRKSGRTLATGSVRLAAGGSRTAALRLTGRAPGDGSRVTVVVDPQRGPKTRTSVVVARR
ncbi:choice-of-anchor A family protein [Nocardioides ferulae]|uniref:choice-of-anchor A family protein n=1 Tax=Nocardioides ferulae TaxID=2340821 RepID=UPI000EB1331B|nr:choice-of-anchor A family protein [Nocardioides ferulae]